MNAKYILVEKPFRHGAMGRMHDELLDETILLIMNHEWQMMRMPDSEADRPESPDQVIQTYPLIYERKAIFEGFSSNLEWRLLRRQRLLHLNNPADAPNADSKENKRRPDD